MNRRELFEKTPILKAIMKVALPSIFGQVIIVLYNIADTLYIGLAGSDEMLTAVSICAPIFMILTAISNLFGISKSDADKALIYYTSTKEINTKLTINKFSNIVQ